MTGPYLKPYTYLQLLDIADHLKLEQPGAINAPGSAGLVMAFLVVQDLKYTARLVPGSQGNQLKIAYVVGGTAGSESVQIRDGILTVTIASGVSTADQIKDAVESNTEAARWFDITVTGTGSNAQVAAAATNLATGADATNFNAVLYRNVVRVMNAACGWIEKEVDGPVMTRRFIGTYDGTNSNVIVPKFFPVVRIASVKVDYNRAFGAESLLTTENYFLRGAGGSENPYQVQSQDVELKVRGTDIVLRDDNETFIVGRIFSGSVLGSIRMVYDAGLGDSAEDLPEDLYHATMQLFEYWYFQGENRDLAVSSKGIRGESYTKMKGNVPDEISDTAQKYKDFSFGGASVPQRNYFAT